MKRRSWLFVPGSQKRMLEKAQTLPADVLIIDWEDAVLASEKAAAREWTRQLLESGVEREVYVRINGTDTPYIEADLASVVRPGLTGVMLPKAAEGTQLEALDRALTREERKGGLSEGSLRVVPLIESAQGVLRAPELAGGPRVQALALGSVDLALNIGARLTREGDELVYARSQLVLISRAAGIEAPIDGVWLDVSDGEGLAEACRRVSNMGFQGKLAIHPGQLSAINDSFLPTEAEVEEAREVIRVYEDSLHQGAGAVKVGSRMVDAPVVEQARRVLRQVESTKILFDEKIGYSIRESEG
ncbi:MAG: CoA ester lyase [Firmicutes bacterium]|nr:CoA ester lyase [Bacillota bacterium]